MNSYIRIPLELLNDLTEKFPDRIPRIRLSEFDIGRLTGEQRIIDYIRNKIREQNELT